MTPVGNKWQSVRPDCDYRHISNSQPVFEAPPLTRRPRLFCCPVAESNPEHLPRSFVNPGRHLMNLQLRSFLECADDSTHTIPRCDVSHIVEVTTRVLNNDLASIFASNGEIEQWNASNTRQAYPLTTPLLNTDDKSCMMMDRDAHDDIPYSTYQCMSTRYFITQNSNNAWQAPPHSRQYRESHGDPCHGRAGRERYMEIPPFKTMPYTSDGSSANGGGGTSARAWIPSCSVSMWCPQHHNYYEVHVLS